MVALKWDGVAAPFPRRKHGGGFSCDSCPTVSHNSGAGGTYFVGEDDGRRFYTRIPVFNLELPQWV